MFHLLKMIQSNLLSKKIRPRLEALNNEDKVLKTLLVSIGRG